MHHLVFGINFQIHFISLGSCVMIHLLMHVKSHSPQNYQDSSAVL